MIQTKIFGCKTNKFYAQQWLGSGELDGYSGIFVVSCVVTNQAKARWVKYIRKEVQDLDEYSYIFLSGCGSLDKGKLDPKFWDKYPELIEWKGKIIPIGEEPHTIIGAKKLPIKKLDASALQEKLKKLEQAKKLYTRKSIVIQSGCDTHCTFCATIQARGSHRNRPAKDIITEIQKYEQEGGKEIVITGINLGAWGATNTTLLETARFPDLLEMILEQTNIPRIRISSTGVEFVCDKLLELYTHPRINPHIHLSIQSGSDTILRSMNRKYGQEKLLDVLESIKNLERSDNVPISIGADIIVGFPGETEEDFQQSLDIISTYNITKLHAFPFSGHGVAHNVPAAKFPNQVANNIKYTHLRKMIEIGDKTREEFIKGNVGKTLTCLIEKHSSKEPTFSGWSENYILLDQNNFDITHGTIAKNSIVTGILRNSQGNSIENTESII